MNDAEILKDLPLIHEKITRCERTILDYERNIMTEEQHIGELNIYIRMDKDLVKQGKKPRYDSAAMLENINRHKNNIELFREKIVGEEQTIKKFREILAVLHNDLGKNPEHIFMHMR